MRLDLYIHHLDSPGATEKLDQILARLETLMSAATDIEKLISDVNDETNAIAARIDAEDKSIQDLKAQIAAGSPATQADLDAISANLTATSARLKALGVDPTNPVPDPQQAATPSNPV